MATVTDFPPELLFETIARLDPDDSTHRAFLSLSPADAFTMSLFPGSIKNRYSNSASCRRPALCASLKGLKDTSDEDFRFQAVITDPFRESIRRLELIVGTNEFGGV